MRSSGEGRCFYPDYGVDATDFKYSLQKIFFNICGLVEAPWYSLPRVSFVFSLSLMLKLIVQKLCSDW